ncbi:MAG: phosphate signaling complex protein PhoU [Pygmaiobacter massiliensis]|uniref:phosphate signaling complex protein PhoU n=1 Tax=Pygmaiobacter massiliensis TaxID=1917873 RepID=UPI002898CDA1|nr:phosphate signaling complex protein PhoU [Pygmaiobacter massiliensis]
MAARFSFDAELSALSASLLRMSSLATEAIASAITAFEQHDTTRAEAVIKGDARLNELEREIEHQCMTLLLRQQPVARDLRIISTAMKMITDIERIGDAAADIAEISRHIVRDIPAVLPDIRAMAEEAQSMVCDAVEAFTLADVAAAKKIIARDDIVDDAFNNIKKRLVSVLTEDSSMADTAIDYLMVIKYLERLGDHAVNVCEWTEYYKTGVHHTGN